MLTASNYNAVQAAVMGNIQGYLTYMMGCKSTVQRQIMDQLSPSEINDIRDCRLNQNVVNKLAQLGKQYYNNGQKSDQYLYCVCMSVGTIIKEYDWGTSYIQQDGMCELASKIG